MASPMGHFSAMTISVWESWAEDLKSNALHHLESEAASVIRNSYSAFHHFFCLNWQLYPEVD